MTNIICRTARREDMPFIYDLVRDLAIYENALESLTFDLEGYYKCFDERIFESIVAELDGHIVGACIYYMTFSTWKGKMLYLEDFVVKESYRKKGIGQVLWDSYINIAKVKDCALVKWQVLDWNEPAIKFYEKNGATIEKEWWNGKIIF
jgi:GNAT superfamily N-acetyltransferase